LSPEVIFKGKNAEELIATPRPRAGFKGPISKRRGRERDREEDDGKGWRKCVELHHLLLSS